MRFDQWLKLTLIRLGVGVIVVILATWLLIYGPRGRAESVIKTQAAAAGNTQSALATAQKTIKDLPRIDQVGIRQLKSFSNYSDQAAQAAKILNKLSISKRAAHVRGFQVGSYGTVIKDANRAIDQTAGGAAAADIELAKRLVNHQAAVAKDLNSVLEYNAAQDMAGFHLGGDDSDQRLKLAEQGLSKTLDALNRQNDGFKDPGLADVEKQIGKMRTALDNLRKSGDTQAWISAANAAQDNIISNRQRFWQAQTKSLLASLAADQAKAAKNQKTWIGLKEKYGL